MKALYLIRKKRQDILGPFAYEELLSLFKKGQPDWEISGHLKPWVFVGNEYLLKKNYPEIDKAKLKKPFFLKRFFNP